MVEVHLHCVCSYLEDNSWDHSPHTVHHRDGVSWNKKVLANLTVNLECCLRKVDDSLWLNLAICVNRCECNIEFVTCLHSLDVCLKLRKKASSAVDIIKRFFYCCAVHDLTIYFAVSYTHLTLPTN